MSLDLSYNPLDVAVVNALLDVLARFSHLRVLRLAGCFSSDGLFEAAAPIRQLLPHLLDLLFDPIDTVAARKRSALPAPVGGGETDGDAVTETPKASKAAVAAALAHKVSGAALDSAPRQAGDLLLFLLFFSLFECIYLVMLWADSYDHQRTMVLLTVLVMNIFSSLVRRPRMLTNSCLKRP